MDFQNYRSLITKLLINPLCVIDKDDWDLLHKKEAIKYITSPLTFIYNCDTYMITNAPPEENKKAIYLIKKIIY